MKKSIEAGGPIQNTPGERITRGKLTGTVSYEDGKKIIKWDDNPSPEHISVDNVPHFAQRRLYSVRTRTRNPRIK